MSETNEIKKAVIPLAGLGTRFLPLSKILSKEFWPLVDIPIIQYIVEEIKNSGISEIVFVIAPENKTVLNYFKKSLKIEKFLKERKKDSFLEELKKIEELSKDISFSYVVQEKPLGDGQAILETEKAIGKKPWAVMFIDDVVESKTPCLFQLIQIFKTCQKPVIALHRLPKEKLSAYGVVGVEKIANRLYKIKKIVEKPSPGEAPSDLAIVGKYILTPEVFDYLKKAKISEKKELILADILDKMIEDGKIIYGYEVEGKWLECGNKLNWLKSHLYLSLKHPEFGPSLKKFLKEIK